MKRAVSVDIGICLLLTGSFLWLILGIKAIFTRTEEIHTEFEVVKNEIYNSPVYDQLPESLKDKIMLLNGNIEFSYSASGDFVMASQIVAFLALIAMIVLVIRMVIRR